MARSRNTAETVQITISTTPVIRGLLEALVEFGFHGKNAAEAGERILSERLIEFLGGNDPRAEFLNRAHKKLISGDSNPSS